MNTDNGGPAYPCDVFDPDVRGPEQHEGMSLRDYFAAKSVTGMLAAETESFHFAHVEDLAKRAYMIADAMLEARDE